MSAQSDEDAIRQCLNGDSRGIEILAQRYQTTALRLAYLLVGNADTAQDIIQESFIRAYHHLDQFHNNQPFAPWFYRIIMNTARQYLRTPQYQRERSLPLWFEAGNDQNATDLLSQPELAAEQAEVHDTMLKAMDSLTMKQREVILLHYYLGYSDQESAMLLGCSQNTVRQRLFAGRKALESIISKHYPWLIEGGLPLPQPPLHIAAEEANNA